MIVANKHPAIHRRTDARVIWLEYQSCLEYPLKSRIASIVDLLLPDIAVMGIRTLHRVE